MKKYPKSLMLFQQITDYNKNPNSEHIAEDGSLVKDTVEDAKEINLKLAMNYYYQWCEEQYEQENIVNELKEELKNEKNNK